jgi:hypothetical protein
MKDLINFQQLIDFIADVPEPSVEYVDNGIGSYEYWGAKGIHHDYDWEIEGESVQAKISFEDVDEELEDVIEEQVYEAQVKFFKELNQFRDDDIDFSDILKLDYTFENNILTLEWVDA